MPERKGTKCAATRKDGTPCNGWGSADNPYCFAHDPDRKAQAHAARSKAGAVKALKASNYLTAENPSELDLGTLPTNRDELRDLAAKTIHWTLAGKLDHKQADAVTKLCQRAMGLFPEAPKIDPADQLALPELYLALQKELRACEEGLRVAGWFKTNPMFRKGKPASKGNGKAAEPTKEQIEDARAAGEQAAWPEAAE